MPSIWDRLKKAFGGSKPEPDFEEDVYLLDDEELGQVKYSELENKSDKLEKFMETFVPEVPDEENDKQAEANRSLGKQLNDRALDITKNFSYSDSKNAFPRTFQEMGNTIARKQINGNWSASREGMATSLKYMQMVSCEVARQIYDNETVNSEKDQVEFLKKASFYVNTSDFEAEFYNGKGRVRDFYNDNEIHAYMDNIRTLREEGDLSKTLQNMEETNDLSKSGRDIRRKLSQMQNKFHYNLTTNPSGLTKNGVLPMFHEADLKDVGELCDKYLKENGYQNTPENKAIRNVKKAVDRATLFRLNHTPKAYLADHENKAIMMSDRLSSIGERLEIVSKGSKSKQFNELCEALKEMNGKDTSKWSAADRERLMNAARDYIDAKKEGFFSGGSTRRTDKGQIRFDIAEEILNLCEGDMMKPSESKAERKAHEQKKVVVREKVAGGYKGLAEAKGKSEGRYTPEKKKRDKEKIAAFYETRRLVGEIERKENSKNDKQPKSPVMHGKG